MEVLRQRAKHRIGARFACQRNGLPAELAGAADLVLAAKGAGHELAAETDAKHRAIGRLEIPDQAEKLREIGTGRVVQRILGAAKHDNRIMRGGIL